MQALAAKLKRLGYEGEQASYPYRYRWTKTYHPLEGLEGLELIEEVRYDPILERGELDPKDIQVPLFPAFTVVEKDLENNPWEGYNRPHLYARNLKAKADDQHFSAVLGTKRDWDKQAFYSVEDIDRFLGQKAVELKQAFEDEELDSDSLELEGLSIQEALRRLHRK